jgi:tetratricopeptide (TPR) repeat protein
MSARRGLGLLGLTLVLPTLGCSSRENRTAEAFDRGNAALDQHDYDTAIAEFTEVIRLDPTADAAYHNRANAYADKKEYAKAVADYEQAIRLAPDDPTGHTDLAWLLATCPDAEVRDGKRAVELATRACQLSGWRDANDLENLAAGYAECGQFDKAVRWQTEALNLGAGLQDENESEQLLELYKAGKPYHGK